MEGEFFKGNIVDICAELEEELERCGKMKVGEWLLLRKIEQKEAKECKVNVKFIRENLKNLKKYQKNI